MGIKPTCLSYNMQQSQPVDMSSISRRDTLPNQVMNTSDAVQFSEYQSSAPLPCHFADMSNQSVPDTSLRSNAKGTQQPYMISSKATLPPHSLQTSGPLVHQSQIMASLTPQYSVIPPHHFFSNQRTSVFQNQGINATTDTQPVNIPFSPSTILTHSISQPISAVVTPDIVRGSAVATPQSIATSTTLSMSVPLNYSPSVSRASNPVFLEQPTLTERSVAGMSTTAAIEVQKPTDVTVLHPQMYDSPFAANKMLSSFARNVVPINNMSTLTKPAHHHLLVSFPVCYVFINNLLY